ncbi:MAG: hypothetical protein GKS06_05775 [Acidobacteria bacterium]|nr:hypothetical protein [Acidobacteriota bacterium]
MSSSARWAPGADQLRIAAALAAVLLWGGLLRLESLHQAYGPVTRGVLALAEKLAADVGGNLRPSGDWYDRGTYPYRFDPKSYLDSAREMRHFYEARLREPLFVAATRVTLGLTGDRDVAGSLVSTLFSVLVLVAAWRLGSAVGGTWVGLAAAGILALETDLIRWAPLGYRTEAFTAFTALFLAAFLRWSDAPTRRRGLVLAAWGAAAALTRLSALSFVVPLLMLALWTVRDRPEARRTAAWAAGTCAALVVPFLVACWWRFGDPLYSVTEHWSYFYQGRGGPAAQAADSVGSWALGQLATQPLKFADSILLGLTAYPWSHKWVGLRPFLGVAGVTALQVAALAGIFGWLWSAKGRVLLGAGFLSMAPFALTWGIYAQPRFTMHVYPLLIVAAVHAPAQWIGAWSQFRRGRSDRHRWLVRSVAPRALLTSSLVLVAMVWMFGIPVVEARSQAASGVSGVAASWRDGFLFGAGWQPPEQEGNQVVRHMSESEALAAIYVADLRALHCTMKIGSTARRRQHSQVLKLTINGDWSRRFRLPPTRELASYEFRVPRAALREGSNALMFTALDGAAAGEIASAPRIRFWYVHCDSGRAN